MRSGNTAYLSAGAIMRETTADMPKAVINDMYAGMRTVPCSAMPVTRTVIGTVLNMPRKSAGNMTARPMYAMPVRTAVIAMMTDIFMMRGLQTGRLFKVAQSQEKAFT